MTYFPKKCQTRLLMHQMKSLKDSAKTVNLLATKINKNEDPNLYILRIQLGVRLKKKTVINVHCNIEPRTRRKIKSQCNSKQE